jgi:hypothetical protein
MSTDTTEHLTAGDPAELDAPLPPEQLSGPARALYDQAAGSDGYHFDVTVDVRDAVEEIVAARLGSIYWNGSWKPGEGSLTVTRIHPLYFVAGGAGDVDIDMTVGTDARAQLVAALRGARLSVGQRGGHRVVVRHPTLTDGEHDATILADIDLDLVTFAEVNSHGIALRGVIEKVRAWPLGAPLLDDEHPEQYPCTSSSCLEHNPVGHLIGPYIAPERAELGALRGQICTLTMRTR